MIFTNFLQNLIVGVAIGAISGLVGSFVILRRMALVGDAMSHVALPGIALSLFLMIDPFWGAIVFLFSAAFIIWWLEGKTRLSTETIVGLLFTTSLAIGILFIPKSEVLESLFGEFRALSSAEFFIILGAFLAVVILTLYIARYLILYTLSQELASLNKNYKYFNLLFLLIFSLVVALGIKLVGTLLMGALTIIPAASARNFSRGITSYIASSAFLGAFVSLIGIFISWRFGILPGPTIILTGVCIFVASLLVKQFRT